MLSDGCGEYGSDTDVLETVCDIPEATSTVVYNASYISLDQHNSVPPFTWQLRGERTLRTARNLWRFRGERYAQNCIMEKNRNGGGSVMVWGGIMKDGKSELIHF